MHRIYTYLFVALKASSWGCPRLMSSPHSPDFTSAASLGLLLTRDDLDWLLKQLGSHLASRNFYLLADRTAAYLSYQPITWCSVSYSNGKLRLLSPGFRLLSARHCGEVPPEEVPMDETASMVKDLP